MKRWILKTWSLMNIFFLIMAMVSPWMVLFSDVLPSIAFFKYGWELLLNLVYALFYFPFDIDYLFFDLLFSLAPVMIIYYLVINIFYFSRSKPSLIIFKIIRIFLVALSLIFFYSSVGFNSVISWGYFVAVIALFSSAIFEFIENEYTQKKFPLDNLPS